MASSSTQVKSLTEEDVRTASKQYDVMFIFQASLPRQGLYQIDPSAFLRCQSLQVVDLSGNKLTTLVGLEPVAAQLTFLNAAENSIIDLAALVQCTALEYCHLEGNELGSVAALQVLVSLPRLVELVLQRTVPLALSDPHDTLLLDNPVCRNRELYETGFLRQVSHIRWVDGVPSFLRCKLLASAESRGDSEAGNETSNEALLASAAASHETTLRNMMADNLEEAKLREVLAEAAKKCTKASQA
ncbi:putative leucine-rich repeat protein (LRRP) [Leptomonas pyrrhocoris]|uniref:Putative leucine-rich repeat protein (LRRP) n=1 Tax=Leptomonas pyrrhocoris TaxID=157538 RepID=A0A0M9G3J8_LEPPY|nr:putative leucine-rich repeat protein (LRRP) [Leptomonas pyrrhocoris]KPA81700.1 putative leucine-rich repeat protein (LRRP) [Leptomonas pyrrhocoris]|eukprot:XP_015660139.1 putative leucine-rich repeat protein (LRRP) [Leptomonas pyrrhocoris]